MNERLEEIIFNAQHKSLTVNPPIHQVTISKEDFDWLIDSVKELEKKIKMYDSAIKEDDATKERLVRQSDKSEEQINHAKQALETIANGDDHTAYFEDIARWALEEMEK